MWMVVIECRLTAHSAKWRARAETGSKIDSRHSTRSCFSWTDFNFLLFMKCANQTTYRFLINNVTKKTSIRKSKTTDIPIVILTFIWMGTQYAITRHTIKLPRISLTYCITLSGGESAAAGRSLARPAPPACRIAAIKLECASPPDGGGNCFGFSSLLKREISLLTDVIYVILHLLIAGMVEVFRGQVCIYSIGIKV